MTEQPGAEGPPPLVTPDENFRRHAAEVIVDQRSWSDLAAETVYRTGERYSPNTISAVLNAVGKKSPRDYTWSVSLSSAVTLMAEGHGLNLAVILTKCKLGVDRAGRVGPCAETEGNFGAADQVEQPAAPAPATAHEQPVGLDDPFGFQYRKR